jgi:phospholipid transport system substrate-binding protein
VGSARAVNDKDTLVSAEIRRDAGPPVALEWRVRDGKVIDVTVEGVSMAISQREEFATYLQGASIDDLIARLKKESAS